MPHIIPLIHELERRARALGSSWMEESGRLGFDRTTLAHVRSGRTRISLTLLHRIAVSYPTDEAIKRLAWEYLLHDVETKREHEVRTATLSPGGSDARRKLSERSHAALAEFVAEFPRHAVAGSGLLLEASDAALLAAGLDFVESECRVRSIHTIRRGASARVPASDLAALSATPLLLVDRADFLSPAMEEVLSSRAAYGKVVLTSRLRDSGGRIPGSLGRLVLHHESV